MAVTISIEANATNVTQTTAQVSANLSAAFKGIQDQMKAMETATGATTSKMVSGLQSLAQQATKQTVEQGNLSKAFLQTGQAAQTQVNQFEKLRQQYLKTNQSTNDLTRGISLLRTTLAAVGVTASLAGLVQLTKSIIEAGIQYERFQRTLQAATGSAEAGQRAFAFLTVESNRLGQSLTTMIPNFALLAAATRGTTLEGEKTRALFSALAGAGVAVGLSTEATGRALVGLIQIISQNAIQLDEFRNQFSSQIPGAMRETARALKEMGVTAGGSIGEMLSLIEKGKLPVETLMEAVTTGLNEVKRTAPEMAESVEVAFAKASNAAFKLKADLARSGLLELYKDILETSRGYIASVGRALGVTPPDFLRNIQTLQGQLSALREAQQEALTEAADLRGFDPAAAKTRADALQKEIALKEAQITLLNQERQTKQDAAAENERQTAARNQAEKDELKAIDDRRKQQEAALKAAPGVLQAEGTATAARLKGNLDAIRQNYAEQRQLAIQFAQEQLHDTPKNVEAIGRAREEALTQINQREAQAILAGREILANQQLQVDQRVLAAEIAAAGTAQDKILELRAKEPELIAKHAAAIADINADRAILEAKTMEQGTDKLTKELEKRLKEEERFTDLTQEVQSKYNEWLLNEHARIARENEKLDEQATRKLERELDQQQRAYERFGERVVGFLDNLFQGLLTGTLNAVDFFKTLLIRQLSNIAANVLGPLVTSLSAGLVGSIADILPSAVGTAIRSAAGLAGVGGAGGGVLDTGGQALAGLGLAKQLFSFLGLDSLTSAIGSGLSGLKETFLVGIDSLFKTSMSAASQAAADAAELAATGSSAPGGGAAAVAGAQAGQMAVIAGGLAALGAGIYGALNASNNAAKAAYAASSAAGAAAAGIAAYAAIADVAVPTLAGLSATGIGLIAAAVLAVVGVVLSQVLKPAGPNLAVGQPTGIGIGEEGGKLTVTGRATSRTLRGEGVSAAQTNAVQQALDEGITRAVGTVIQTINAVALDPAKLLGPTQEALRHALSEVQTINSASAKHMEKDIAEQLRFTTTAFVANMLEPINLAFEQLVDSDLKTQIDRLPVTTIGLVDIFKTLNTQLDEMANGENRDVLGQIQGTREAVARFGARLAQTAGDTAEQIVNGLIKEFDDAIERTQPLKLVSDFSHNLGTLITTFNERMTEGLLALVSLQKTQQTLEAAGLPGAGVGSQVDRLSAELAQQGEIFSTQIVTRALENLSSELDKIVVQPIRIQATTVDSLFSDSLAALNSLWLEWHRLADAGIDTTRMQEQFTKLLGGLLDSSATLLRNALQKGTFPEFLDVLLSIPDALAKMNPVFERLKALGQAFAQVVGPIQQAISQGEEQLRTPTERVDRTAQQMRELQAAITDAGTSADKALPLYAQLAAAITANAEAQIAAVQQVGAVIEQITAILDARLTTSQRLAQVNQEIADLQAGRQPGAQTDVTPPWLRISDVAPPSVGPQTIEDLSQLVTLYGQQLDLMGQLIDAIQSGLDSIDQTLRADETVNQRATRLVAAATPPPDVLRIPEQRPEALLRQAGALQDAIGAVRELIDVIEQGLQNIADILHANETISERAARLVEAVTLAVPSQDPEALIRLASGIGDALTAVRALIDAIQQGLQQIQDILHATETVTARAVRLVGAVPSTVGITDPEALITIAGQIGDALTAVRAVIDLVQGGIDSIDSTLVSLLSVAEQSADLQAKIAAINTDIARAGAATPEQLITLVGLTQQALSLQQQITKTLESTLQDLQSSFVTTGSPASQLTDTRAQIDALQTLADTGAATPEQLQQLVDLNQQLLSLGTQFDLLDVQQEALDSLKALAPVIQDQIDASKAREQALINSLVEIKGTLEAQIVVAKSTEEQLLGQLTGIQTLLQGMLTEAQLTEQQLLAQLINVQLQLLEVLAAAKSIEAQLIDQLVNVRALLAAQLIEAQSAEAITIRYLDGQLAQLQAQLILQYGTANVDLIIKQIQEWQLTELRTLNQRLKDLFVAQPDAQALFGVQPILNAQSIEMGTQTVHLRNISDQTGTVIHKLDDLYASLNRPLRTTPAQSGGFLYASLNRAATGPLTLAHGGMVAAILEPGERVFPPPFTSSQRHALMAMNTQFPRFGTGGWTVPGSGSGDHVPAMLPSGSFVLNRRASGQAGYQGGGVVSGSVSTNHVTINIQIVQRQGQSGRELVDLITRQLKKEFRTRNDPGPFK